MRELKKFDNFKMGVEEEENLNLINPTSGNNTQNHSPKNVQVKTSKFSKDTLMVNTLKKANAKEEET